MTVRSDGTTRVTPPSPAGFTPQNPTHTPPDFFRGSQRLPVGESTSQAGTGPATGSRRWDGQGIDVARPECDRPVGFVRVIGNVAKRKPASTVSGEQSDRQLSAGASRQTGP